MAIINLFGKTESGKSFRAELLSKKYKRVVIYDNAHCFKDGEIINDLSPENLSKVLKRIMPKKSFTLIFRAPASMSEQKGANRIASFVFQLGLFYKETCGGDFERFLFLVDEAHLVSSQSKENSFYRAVTKGRHYCFDTFGISQGYTKLPNYWRDNQKEAILFKLPVTSEIKKLIGNSACVELEKLGQFEYLHWFDNKHEIEHYDKNGKLVKKIANN